VLCRWRRQVTTEENWALHLTSLRLHFACRKASRGVGAKLSCDCCTWSNSPRTNSHRHGRYADREGWGKAVRLAPRSAMFLRSRGGRSPYPNPALAPYRTYENFLCLVFHYRALKFDEIINHGSCASSA